MPSFDPSARPHAGVDAAYEEALGNISRKQRRRMERVLQDFQVHASDPTWFITEAEPGIITYAAPALSQEARDGLQAFEQAGLEIPFDWTVWQRGKELLTSPELIEQASAIESAKAIVMAKRADRINEGLLVTCLQNGVITALLGRLLTASP